MNDSFAQAVRVSLDQADYAAAVALCERWIEAQPDQAIPYGYLGVGLLLQDQELEAQTAWMMPVMETSEAEGADYMRQLVQVLINQAAHQEAIAQDQPASLLRRYIQEFDPENLANGLQLMWLSLKQSEFSWELSEMTQVLALLEQTQNGQPDPELLQRLLAQILTDAPFSEQSLRLATVCLDYAQGMPDLLTLLHQTAHGLGWGQHEYSWALRYAELGFQLCESDRNILRLLASFYEKTFDYTKAIAMARRLCELSDNLADRCNANSRLLINLMSAGGYWQEITEILDQQKLLIQSLLQESSSELLRHQISRLFGLGFVLPHLQDTPAESKPWLNQLAGLCQRNVQNYAGDRLQVHQQNHQRRLSERSADRPLRIGYLSHCLRRHPVGWLAWGFYQHCDRQKFEIYTYFTDNMAGGEDNWHKWYATHSTQTYAGTLDSPLIADQINKDEIDILVDLDSITVDIASHVLSMRPAPVQVSWLGFDASGIPTVDYFIVDPYVLPAEAQDYYSETLWRLPQTYLAVDGFEVGCPTLRREDLNIPADAVVYLSNQRASKRNPEMSRLQIQMIKAVPNSYFLIKGFSDAQAIQDWFLQLAAEEGVAGDRLKFLPNVRQEEEHRANLQIADVILDTYPYNGATTTLEALWMEIPIVTRVGEQFAARNSYTFLVNAGVREGIAWTPEEYLEWGVRLGKDHALRQQVVWKLKQAKKTSPLWNAKQFTRQMEAAFQQMWQRYREGGPRG
jgi:predicted O-linked N-acetylglucosamine transferase (SPINDLY family)